MLYRFLRKRISEFKLKEDNTMRINGFSGTNTQTGTMVFDWKDSSDKTFKTLESLEIGYITDRTNPILLDFDLMTLNPINDVQVKVIEDMNLGVVFAGERLSTKNSQNNGHPAKIEIKGKNKKRVVIKIPKIAKITNEKKDSLDVSLSFRENNSQVLIKEFNKDKGNESNNGMVSLKDILIQLYKSNNRDPIALEEKGKESAMAQIPMLEKHMWMLSLTAHITPLLGLLGTVTGMIKAFQAVSIHGTGDASVLAKGISEALFTTAGGLFVAIPATIFYNYFNKKIDEKINDMEKTSTELINYFRR